MAPSEDIRITLDSKDPLAGTASTGRRGPLRFEGWLELLRVLAILTGTDRGAGLGGSEEVSR